MLRLVALGKKLSWRTTTVLKIIYGIFLGCLCILLWCASLVKADFTHSAINNQNRRAGSGSDIPVVDELSYPEATNEDSAM